MFSHGIELNLLILSSVISSSGLLIQLLIIALTGFGIGRLPLIALGSVSVNTFLCGHNGYQLSAMSLSTDIIKFKAVVFYCSRYLQHCTKQLYVSIETRLYLHPSCRLGCPSLRDHLIPTPWIVVSR